VQSLGALGEITARTTGNAIPKRSVFLEDQGRVTTELTLWYDDAKNAATLFKVPCCLCLVRCDGALNVSLGA
jgi:hypothetical protein